MDKQKVIQVSARKSFLIIAVLLAFMALGMSVGGLVWVVGEVKQEASRRQCDILASAVQASIHNDLLSSNMLLAADRLRSMIEPEQWQAFCLRITPADPDSKDLIQMGDQAICDSPSFYRSTREIYFDQAQTESAYSVLVSSDPNLIGFSPSKKLVTIMIGVFVMFAGLLGGLWFFANSILISIFTIIEGGTPANFGKRFTFQEYIATYNLIKDRDAQALLAEKAQSKVRETVLIADLSSRLAHDIRSPLAALNMVASQARSFPAEQADLLLSATKRIQSIANDLLVKKKMVMGGNFFTSAQSTTVGGVLSVASQIVGEKKALVAGAHQIKITDSNFSEAGLQTSVVAWDLELGRILSNLIDNSIEAMPADGGSIALDLYQEDQKYIVLSVRDNGKGIADEIVPLLFSEGASFGKQDGSGFGLGLFSCRQRVEAWGGICSIDSKLGLGTTVTIKLRIKS